MKRWLLFVAVWQALLLVALVVYTLLLPPRGRGLTWALPPLGGLVGTALPLQLAVVRIARAALS